MGMVKEWVVGSGEHMCGLQVLRAQAKGSKPTIRSYSRSPLPPAALALLGLQCACVPALGNEDQRCLEASDLGKVQKSLTQPPRRRVIHSHLPCQLLVTPVGKKSIAC